eukprot:4893171-Pyramimonas_sp.AAC.1
MLVGRTACRIGVLCWCAAPVCRLGLPCGSAARVCQPGLVWSSLVRCGLQGKRNKRGMDRHVIRPTPGPRGARA